MLSLSFILRLGVFQGLLTPAICYLLGMYYNHLDTIPMISDCGIYQPERYVFRIGSITSACLIGTAGIGIYTSDNTNYSSVLGLIMALGASFGLACLGAVNITENWTIHTVSAVIFLISFGSYVNFITLKSRHKSTAIFYMRLISAIINSITLLIFLILHYDFDKFRAYIAVLEWLFFLNGLTFLFLFSWEFKHRHLKWMTSGNSSLSI